jgi:hypothetical protein
MDSFTTSGMVSGEPRAWLRFEGLALFAAAVWAYSRTGVGWPVFALLFFAPDLSLLGYLAGPRIGAALYNLLHSTVGPLALGGAGLATGHWALAGVAAIWLAHVGFDRALGYGLKHPGGFALTHLGRIGRLRPEPRP